MAFTPAGQRLAAHALLHEGLSAMPEDRLIAPDIEAAAARVRDGSLSRIFRTLSGLPALWTPA